MFNLDGNVINYDGSDGCPDASGDGYTYTSTDNTSMEYVDGKILWTGAASYTIDYEEENAYVMDTTCDSTYDATLSMPE